MPLFNGFAPTEAQRSSEEYARAADPDKAAAAAASSQNVLTLTGLGALALLVTFPLTDAVILVRDFNFVFWGGVLLPMTVIVALLGMLMGYVMVISHRSSNGLPVRDLANMAAGFCLLVGMAVTGLNYRHIFTVVPSTSTAVIIALLSVVVMYIIVLAVRNMDGYRWRDLGNIAAPFGMLIGAALTLLNYVHHGGPWMPEAIIMSLAGVLIIYFMVICARGVQSRSGRELANVAATFCMFVGLTLGLASLFLFYQDVPVANALKYACSGNAATMDASRHYSALLRLRETPACAQKVSIVECAGYASVAPPQYAKYFQSLEEEFRCSGFCHARVQNKANAALEIESDSAALCQTKVSLLASHSRSAADPDASPDASEGSAGTTAANEGGDAQAAEPTTSDAKEAGQAAADKEPAPAAEGAATTTAAAPAAEGAATTTAPAPGTLAASVAASARATAAAPAQSSNGKASHLPPALFSQTPSKSSCDSAASHALNFSVKGTAKVWCWMAMALIATSAALSFGDRLSSQ